MKICVVNERDEIIGYKERDDRNQHDIIRVAGLWLLNSRGEILLAQRALDKVNDPGKWGPSVAGTVEEGETYLSNIIKEAEEEIELSLTEKELTMGAHALLRTSHAFFYQFFIAHCDLAASAFKVKTDEVAQVQWKHIDEVEKWLAEFPEDFIKSFSQSFAAIKQMLPNVPSVN